MAEPVARRLGAPLDVCVVRKIGLPGHEELAMGAVASGGIVLVNPALVDRVVCAATPRLERAIAVLHLDATTAVEPLERMALWEVGESPETYPTGI